MTGWVLDCSLALAWGLPDETSAVADEFWQRAVADGHDIWVPALWHYEMANALVVARRRGRLSQSDHKRLTSLYAGLPLHTEPPDALTGASIAELALTTGLSAYDAAYVDLAQRRGVGLATLDERLASAAIGSGLLVWS